MISLSKRQQEVLIAIEVDKERGINPTMSTLARDFKVSFVRMRQIILELEHKGYIMLVTPVKQSNRVTSEKHIRVLKPVLSKNEEYVIIGNNLTENDIKGMEVR